MNAALTLAPMSGAVAAIWHQLQAEILKEMPSPVARLEGSVVLQPMTGGKTEFRSAYQESAVCMEIEGPAFSMNLYRTYITDSDGRFHYPGKWWGMQTRKDQHGAWWSKRTEIFVCDDFGNLVEVQS